MVPELVNMKSERGLAWTDNKERVQQMQMDP